ncbi:2-C-methyl-D-erythritol 2,4-cyclodiphosphate synthase [Thiopseudomonas alkaliphila]|uniref:2-C-methyl-D-erythritol 2,4-cyclodiphosphate synthase n=1 Tax=Thiopseudomonas alkaliphila TaxID=1697053 RepID=UPI002575B56D|nr:2-C-methyl-D-erythritol 2,4-cyclodiphosphate synthase [Thiopseudomonas alkaliphila]MDM1715690.1 2-C-methyl-D-erythritol 2,4-cyclodiphosphate synthase [Thiopseudomonas alkaliphila]
MRIGQGYDVHRFGAGDHLTIGGVKIPFSHGFVAHSDGDVLLHALCDALLGACALGDIGRHYPDTDPQFKGADSRQLLKDVMSKVRAKGYQVVNLDLTILAQAPKMSPYIERMCQVIASDLALDVTQVNVKATTTESLGFVGRKEGIAAQAIVLLASV